MTRWVESRLPVISVDEKERIVSFSKRSVFELAPGDLYYAEGAFEFLDEPGEWYLDPAAGTLYYLPRPGETARRHPGHRARAAAGGPLRRPARSRAIRRARCPARPHLLAHRMVFPGRLPERQRTSRTSGPLPPRPRSAASPRRRWVCPAPCGARACATAVFENCRFADLGNYGLELARGCQSNRIIRCEFSDLGAGGVKIGETAHPRPAPPSRPAATKSAIATSTTAASCSPAPMGIWIGQSPDNRIAHNLIHDFYYTGISIGWTWGYGPALATNNIVELNHVHHIGVKSDGDGPILSDMGGIYTLGMQPGTTIRNNLWHDIAGLPLRRLGHLLRRRQQRHPGREQRRLSHHARRLPPALRRDQRRPQQHLRLRARPPDPAHPPRAAPQLHLRHQHRLFRLRHPARPATCPTTTI